MLNSRRLIKKLLNYPLGKEVKFVSEMRKGYEGFYNYEQDNVYIAEFDHSIEICIEDK
jgi:hypothetical protein